LLRNRIEGEDVFAKEKEGFTVIDDSKKKVVITR